MWASFVRFGPGHVLWHRAGASSCRQYPLLSSIASTVRLRPSALAIHSGHLCCAASVAPLDEQRDTIAALSSGSGKCGVALLRVSGPGAGETSDQKFLLGLCRLTLLKSCRPSTAELVAGYQTATQT